MSTTEYTQIKDLKPGMKNINAVFIVLEVGPVTLTKEAREVRSLRVADASASINLSLWDAPGALLQPGDIVRLSRGYAALWRFALTLYSGKGGDIQKIGEFCMLFNEQVNMSELQPMQPQPPGGGAGGGGMGGGAANGAGGGGGGGGGAGGGGAPAGAKLDRFTAQHASDAKHPHKTYVRGRGHQRGNNRR